MADETVAKPVSYPALYSPVRTKPTTPAGGRTASRACAGSRAPSRARRRASRGAPRSRRTCGAAPTGRARRGSGPRTAHGSSRDAPAGADERSGPRAPRGRPSPPAAGRGHPDGRVVEVRGQVADVLARLSERRLAACGEDLVLVDGAHDRGVEIEVLERQPRDVGQHQQGVGPAHRSAPCSLQGRAQLVRGMAAPKMGWITWEQALREDIQPRGWPASGSASSSSV